MRRFTVTLILTISFMHRTTKYYYMIGTQKLLLFFVSLLFFLFTNGQVSSKHNLEFSYLANRWDEAMPMGNGMLGVLVWQKNENLRLSLDRADLWDERKALDLSQFNFKWVENQVIKKDYGPVQKLGDWPYDRSPYPTKLPAAAMEFDIHNLGRVISNTLDIKTAFNTIKFESGVTCNIYIHAKQNIGYFAFENLNAGKVEDYIVSLKPKLVVHHYNSELETVNDNSHAGAGLQKLGYAKGTVVQTPNTITYRQPTYNGQFYEIKIQWKKFPGNKVIGSWVIENNKPAIQPVLITTAKEPTGWNTHRQWWNDFWSNSSITLPDTLLEKQYYLDMYKLGATARKGAPAITLQAVWTADNGSLPPWKGDFHNDLNTQLSYWPAYTGNRLKESATFTDWLWKIRPKNLNYTKQYFGVDGLNVPGVATISGEPMGGWIQYSLSPTVVAWCAQHFYWQWKYTMDDQFLKTRAYTYLHEGATYLENITRLINGVRVLPLSSSPEYNDNDISAWFLKWSNFDLALAKFLFTSASEVALAIGKKEESTHWHTILKQLPDYEVNETGFTIAPGQNLNESHRHMSQYMAIYPLALLDYNKAADKILIDNSLKRIEEKGTRGWVGYSFSWMACLYARAYQADSAVKHLRIFSTNFCSPNSFHLNGDQKGGQYAAGTYRPFTLEGNFAFAQGIHELLLQSRMGYVDVFPAVPKSWSDVSFDKLRTEGAFIISANIKNGVPAIVKVVSEKGGRLNIKLPFKTWLSKSLPQSAFKTNDTGIVSVNLKKGQTIIFENGYE
jgi:alpha-L-fucosidase 2